MIALSLPWYGFVVLAVMTVWFGAMAAAWVVDWLQDPSWEGTIPVLGSLALLAVPAWVILNLLGIAIPRPPAIPTPWLLIVVGVGVAAIVVYEWIHDDPNIEVSGPFFRSRGALAKVLVAAYAIALGVAMTWWGLAGLSDQRSDQRYMQKGLDFLSAAAKFEKLASLYLSILVFIASIFFTVSELRKPPEDPKRNVAAAVAFPLVLGVVILVNWWLRF